MGKSTRPHWRSWWSFLPAGAVVGLLTLIPVFLVLYASLTDWTETSGPTLVGITGYEHLLRDSYFVHSTKVTITFAVASSLLSVALGIAVACALHSFGRWRFAMLVLCSMPLLISSATAAMVWRLALNEQTGLIPQLIYRLGGARVGPLADPNGALLSACVVDVWQWTPLVILLVFAALERANAQVIDLAVVDGLGASTRFWRLFVPIISPVISLALLIRFSDALRAFDVAQVLTSGGPGNATEFLSLFAYARLIKFGNYSAAAISAVAMLALASVALLVIRFLLRRRIFERGTL